jgi:hypothetical protein
VSLSWGGTLEADDGAGSVCSEDNDAVGPAHCRGTFSESSTHDVLALEKVFRLQSISDFGISDNGYRTVYEFFHVFTL